MVPIISIVWMCVSLVLSLVLPIVLAIVFHKRGISKIKVFFLGMIGFVLPQLIIRIPLLQLLSTRAWYQQYSHTIIFFVILALSAGLFEAFGRLFVFKGLLKKNRDYKDGLMAGLGHGGIEAILLVGVTFISNIITSIKINTGAMDATIATVPDANIAMQLKSIITTLSTTKPEMFLIGGVERVMAIVVQIALSLLVLEGIKRNKTAIFMVMTILIHGLLDFCAVYLSTKDVNVLIIELVVLVFVVIGLYYIKSSKKRFDVLLDKEA